MPDIGPKDWSPLPTCSFEVAENIAAISINLGQSKKHMEAYHAALANKDGFVGFYVIGAEMGIALEAYAKRTKIVWGSNADWIDTTMALAEAILDFMIDRRRLPKGSLEHNKLIEASIARV